MDIVGARLFDDGDWPVLYTVRPCFSSAKHKAHDWRDEGNEFRCEGRKHNSTLPRKIRHVKGRRQ